MSTSDSITVQLYRCRKVILEMLEERGYNVDHLKNYTIDTVREMREAGGEDDLTRQINIYVRNEEKDKRCFVLFVLNSKFKKMYANDAMDELIDEDSPYNLRSNKDECVFICIHPVKESGIDAVNGIYNEHKINAQVFYIKELLYNPLHHTLVPKFRILTTEEISRIKNKYHVQRLNQFPIIKKHDAVGKFIGIRIGDVVEITNKSRNGGVNIYYRYCDG